MGTAQQNIELLATQLYFQAHKETDNFNTPEMYEPDEGGYLAKARSILHSEDESKLYKIVITRDLIAKMFINEKFRTFRKRCFRRKFYQVFCTRFTGRQCEKCPHCIIEIIDIRKIRLDRITDAQAKSAGAPNKQALVEYLRAKYGRQDTFWLHTFQLVA